MFSQALVGDYVLEKGEGSSKNIGKIISINSSTNNRDVTTSLYTITYSKNNQEVNVKRSQFYIQNKNDNTERSII